ncbi:MAG TPA: HypC/HybG/HupF family hydrogenase formation chaperone [Bacteroidales bacterium]|nr:HypC/HybG/HupF family hydrogenase formation chaperone [Bacteroidales bacterium]
MCLSIPARIEAIIGEMAKSSVGEAFYEASLTMLDLNEIAIGDYVLLHTGFALQKISEQEALETLKLFDEFEAFNEQLDKEEQQTGKRIV